MCMGLGRTIWITMPMYMWLNNKESVTRNDSNKSLEKSVEDFVHATKLSSLFLLDKGVNLFEHLKYTMEFIDSMKPYFSQMAADEYKELLSLLKYEKMESKTE